MTYIFAILSLILLAIVLRAVTKKAALSVPAPVPEEVRDEDDVQMLRDDEEDTLTFVRLPWENKP
jgi:Na+-transporting methylmalonyl-CoA/oxaloacetate decarboxylase gamma subunit